jgi:hypothetical protein
MKNFISFISFMFFCVNIFAQSISVKIIDKSKFLENQKPYDTTKLTWLDFRKIMTEDDTRYANTAIFISMGSVSTTKKNDTKLTITTQFYFDKNKSSKKRDANSDYVLKHEQLHFDIGWYWYQVFLRELRSAKFDNKKYMAQAKTIFNENNTKLKAMQVQYDEETGHSINEEKQAEWSEIVRCLLEELDEDAN